MREAIRIIFLAVVWCLGAVFVLGLMITTKALKFFERLEERFFESEE